MVPFLLLVFVLLAVPAEAAVLRGTIYDLSLDKAHDVTVDISTLPQQRYLSKDGTYSFKVAAGNYTLKAQQYKDETVIAQANEQVIIQDTSDYHLDLVLFPVVESQDELLGDAIFDIEKIAMENKTPWWAWAMGAVLLIVIVASSTYLYTMRQRKTPNVILSSSIVREVDKVTLEKALSAKNSTMIEPPKEELKADVPKDDLQAIVSFIEKEGGRTTQKELRKSFPYSEAKISLMLAELEHKGTLEKIKKGRGNILILKNQEISMQQHAPSEQ